MIPDGSGAIIYFNNGKTIYDSYYAPVYGKYRDIPSLSVYSDDSVRLPVFGMKRDNDAFIAVIHQNESTAFINASVSGKYTGYNSVFPSFQYKVIEANVGETYTQPYAPVLAPNGNYEVRYYFLTGDAADYSGMAQKYRQYLVDEKGLQKAQNINQSSLYIDLYGGVVKEKSILGIPREVFEPLTTFTQLKELSNDLKSKGIDSIVFRYMEWMRGKDRGKVPVKAMPDKKLGSQKAFMDFISYAVNNNIGFYPNVNLIHFSRNGGGFNRLFDAVKAPGQSPAFQYEKDNPHIALGRRWYLLNPQGVQKAAGKYINSFNKYGNNAISIDSLGNTVYSDNRKNGTMRGDITDIWTDVLASIKKNSYSIMLEDANAYAFPYTDRIVNAPSPERRIEIADEAIPFYQMALHGYIPYTTSPINLSSDPELAFLKAIETGSDIHYTFVMNDTSILKDTYLDYLYSCNPDFWMDTAVEQYKNAANIYTQLKEKPIVKHSKLQEGVYETVYEGNIHIVVNYNSNDVNVDGNIIKAKGFARIER